MTPVILPLYCLVTFVLDREVFMACQSAVRDAGRNMFLLIFVFEFFKKKKIPIIGKAYHFLAILCVYIVFQSFVLHPGVMTLWSDLSELLSLLLPLVVMVMRPDMLPSPQNMFKFIGIILILQVLGTLLNINGIQTYLTFYIPYDYVLGNGELYFGEEGLAMGTFPSPSYMSNFSATVFLFLSLEYFSKGEMHKRYYYMAAIIIAFLIICSGIRVSLVLYFSIFWICCLVYIKKHVPLLFSITLTAMFAYFALLSVDVKNMNDSEGNEGIVRQIKGLARAVQATETTETGTTGLSAYLFDNYFDRSPIIGNGLSYKGEYAYGNFGTVTLTNFKADSRLALIFVEYGIIGALIYFLFFFSIFVYINRRLASYERKKLLVCFCYYLILTSVDPGFFDRLCFPMLYVYALSVLHSSNQYPSAVKNAVSSKRYV